MVKCELVLPNQALALSHHSIENYIIEPKTSLESRRSTFLLINPLTIPPNNVIHMIVQNCHLLREFFSNCYLQGSYHFP